MYFTRKRYSFDAFDGKSILSAYLDFPADGEGLSFDYLCAYVNRCFEFIKDKLSEAIRAEYLAEYNKRRVFDRYCYELNIRETYVQENVSSYLICVLLKRGTEIVCVNTDSVVFQNNMILPPEMICRCKTHTVLLNEDGMPSVAKHSDGRIHIEKIGNIKFSAIYNGKPSAE